MQLTAETFAKIADHTLLRPDTTPKELQGFIDEATRLGVSRICVSPSLLPVNKEGLEIVTVVGFPNGAQKSGVKAAEARQAVADGADEIDMVANAAFIKSANWEGVENEVSEVKRAIGSIPLKVILETANLSETEITESARAAARAGAQYVKTSTGFHPAGGATKQAVELLTLAVAGFETGVKASGGIRGAKDAQEMWSAGADRFGVSATAQILEQLRTGNTGATNTAETGY